MILCCSSLMRLVISEPHIPQERWKELLVRLPHLQTVEVFQYHDEKKFDPIVKLFAESKVTAHFTKMFL